MEVEIIDTTVDYVKFMEEIFDFDLIRKFLRKRKTAGAIWLTASHSGKLMRIVQRR